MFSAKRPEPLPCSKYCPWNGADCVLFDGHKGNHRGNLDGWGIVFWSDAKATEYYANWERRAAGIERANRMNPNWRSKTPA